MHLSRIQTIEMDDTTQYFPSLTATESYLGVALAGEVGEVCNDIKKFVRGDFDFVELRNRLRGELPDVLIYLVMLAGVMGIDLEAAWEEKKEYNERRYRPVAETE